MQTRLPHVKTTIFTVMSRLAVEHNAINLGQGFPSFQPAPELVELIAQAMRDGNNQYAPMEGVVALREAISEKAAACYGYRPDPQTEITVTSGGTEALFSAIAAVISSPGDEVIVLEPNYDSYGPGIILNGGIVVPVSLTLPSAEIPVDKWFKPDFDRIEAAITTKTRAIIFNTPHNPTGTVWSADEVQTLGRLAAKHNLYLIADEVYEHISFDGIRHESILRYPEIYGRAFVVHSFGKTFHATGFKLGYAIAPPMLSAELRKVHQYVTFSSFTPIQVGLAKYLQDPTSYHGLNEMYQTKRDQMLKSFEITGLKPLPCQGTYFQLYDYSALSELGDQEFARLLVKEAGVAAIPVSSFYLDGTDNRLLRFCFAKDEALMQTAAERIRDWKDRQSA